MLDNGKTTTNPLRFSTGRNGGDAHLAGCASLRARAEACASRVPRTCSAHCGRSANAITVVVERNGLSHARMETSTRSETAHVNYAEDQVDNSIEI